MIVNNLMIKVKSERIRDIPTATEKLLNMKGNVPVLKDVKVHKDIAQGGRSYDLLLITRFANMDDFREYITDPYHTEVGKFIVEIMEKGASVCYEE